MAHISVFLCTNQIFFMGKNVLEISMNSVTIAFNDGSTAVENVMHARGIKPSIFMQEGLHKLD